MPKNKGFALNDKISLRQMQALLFLEIFGFGITALPRRVAQAAANDGWVGVVAATFVVLLMVLIITQISKKTEYRSFYDMVCALVSTPVGTLICLFMVARLALLAAFNLRIFAEITQTILLPTTPTFVVFAAMLALCAYGASKGMESRARMAELLILVVLLPLVVVFGISGREIDFTNLLPLFHADPASLGNATFNAFFAFNGIDMLLLIIPFISNKKSLTKSALGVVATMGGFMVILTAVTIARFGATGVTSHTWPFLKMMDTMTLPGSVIDRQGALMMTFWIISAYAIINAALFFSSLLLKDVVKRGNHFHYILITAPIIGILAALPRNLPRVYELFDKYNRTFSIGAMVILPILLLVASKIRRRLKNA
ncbi:MAG: spore germination protein [Defluviitaleaceae bacterium]|nr:spore germination protein [Defluviitaleaceae bacterium]